MQRRIKKFTDYLSETKPKGFDSLEKWLKAYFKHLAERDIKCTKVSSKNHEA